MDAKATTLLADLYRASLVSCPTYSHFTFVSLLRAIIWTKATCTYAVIAKVFNRIAGTIPSEIGYLLSLAFVDIGTFERNM